jgi:hypothetical protein
MQCYITAKTALTVLFWLLFPGSPVFAVLSWLFFSGCPVLTVMCIIYLSFFCTSMYGTENFILFALEFYENEYRYVL